MLPFGGFTALFFGLGCLITLVVLVVLMLFLLGCGFDFLVYLT